MDPIAPYLERLRGSERLLHAQICLQTACNSLTPGDLTRLYLRLGEPDFAWLHPDLARVAPFYRFMTAPPRRRAMHRPQLVALPRTGAVTCYETPGIRRQDKRLYIFLSGSGGQFFVPFAMLLYLLPPGPKDVLLIRGNMGWFLLDGIEGLGRTIPEICRSLRAGHHIDDYRHLTVAGFSSTGYQALKLADGLEADLGVTLAARLPFAALRLKQYRERNIPAYSDICACRRQCAGRLVNVFPTKFEMDVASSRRLKAMRPRLIQFHLITQRNHNVLAAMARARTIRPFMLMLFAEKGAALRLLAPVSVALGMTIRWIRFRIGKQVERKPL